MPQRLNRRFYSRPVLTVAKSLLGCKLVTCLRGKKTSGIIVEVEAYHGDCDQACHAYQNQSKRNEVMFKAGGHCYVYFIYGMHHCVNAVAEKPGTAAAVLIRSIEPLEGIEIMKHRRHLHGTKNLTNGPSRLCQALGINKRMLGEDMPVSSLITIERYRRISTQQIGVSRRIGISKSRQLPWRFFLIPSLKPGQVRHVPAQSLHNFTKTLKVSSDKLTKYARRNYPTSS